MRTYLIAFVIATVVAVLLTPIVRRLAPHIGAIDLPSGRHINKQVIPRLGGIAILAGFMAPLIGLFIYDNNVSKAFTDNLVRDMALMIGGVAIAALGAYDDIKGARAVVKLGVQVLVAVAAYAGGFRIESVDIPYFGVLEMGIFAAPVTVFWIVGIINAVNLIDGLDGLAAGVAFFVCIVNFVIGMISGNVMVALFSASLAGALLGFLVFNFNPATIFMGDTGSMFIGYVLATTSLLGSKGSTAVAMLVPVLAMGVPIMDTLLAIVRRFLEKRPIFSPDRGHIHHRLLDMGLSHRRVVLILYGLSILFTGTAIVIYLGREDWQVGVALLVATMLVFVMMRTVGMFQTRATHMSQMAGVYADITNRVRNAMPRFIIGLSKAEQVEQVRIQLEQFCVEANLVFMQCTCQNSHPLSAWTWENTAGSVSERGYISAKYPLKCPTGAVVEIKFGWISDTATVTPQTDVLLKVVTDELERKLVDLKEAGELPCPKVETE